MNSISKNSFLQLRVDKEPTLWLYKNLLYRSSDEFCYANSLKLVTNSFRLIRLSQIWDYWIRSKRINVFTKFSWSNWMYLACLKYSFRRIDHITDINIRMQDKTIGIEKYLKFQKFPCMNASEIKSTLNDPILICNQGVHIVNGLHRSLSVLHSPDDLLKYANFARERTSCSKCNLVF